MQAYTREVCSVLLRPGSLHSLRLGEAGAVGLSPARCCHTPPICLESSSWHGHCGAGGSAPAAVSLVRSPDEWLRLGAVQGT